MFSHPSLSIPFAKLEDSPVATEASKNKAITEVTFEENAITAHYDGVLDWMYQQLGEAANLEWMFGPALLREDSSDDEDEIKSPTHETFAEALTKLCNVFEKFNSSLEAYTLQVDPKSDIERIKALNKLEHGIRAFTGKLTHFYNQSGLLTEDFIKAFNTTERAEKELLAKRIDAQVPVHTDLHARMQSKLKYLRLEISSVLEEIKNKYLTAEQLLNAAEVKHKQSQKIVTKEIFYEQIRCMPDLLMKFYFDIVELHDIRAEHKQVGELQTKIRRVLETYNNLTFAEQPSLDFASLVLRAIASQKVFLGDLIGYGNYSADIKRLLLDTDKLLSTLLDKAVEPYVNLLPLTENINAQVMQIRRDYGVFIYSIEARRGVDPTVAAGGYSASI